MPEARIIKRYANRKLYDTEHSCYVTLDQIAELIRKGVDVKIIDNNSKDDLTSVTLTQIIFEEEKKRRLLPLMGLRSIIQTSGESIQDFVTQIREDLDQRVGRVFRRPNEGEAAGDGTMPSPETPATEPVKTAVAFREFLESSQRRLDEWQTQIDVQIRKAVENLHPLAPYQKELATAITRIEALEQKIAALEARLSPPVS
jgi:polyhydroxyalkanoate synthesis repressor PhaR